MARVGDAYDSWRASGQDAVWVTHAGVMRAVLLLHEGVRKVERADRWPTRTIGLGELMDGWEATRQIKARPSTSVPCAVSTHSITNAVTTTIGPNTSSLRLRARSSSMMTGGT